MNNPRVREAGKVFVKQNLQSETAYLKGAHEREPPTHLLLWGTLTGIMNMRSWWDQLTVPSIALTPMGSLNGPLPLMGVLNHLLL